MKRKFLFKLYEPNATDAGGSAAILKAIGDVSETVKTSVDKVKSDITVDVDGKLKAAKEGQEKAISDAVKAATKDLDEEIGKLKADNQRITVKLDEAEQKAAATYMNNGVQKDDDFATVLQKELEKHHDDLQKIARKDNGRNQHLVIDLKAVGDVTTANVTGTAWSQINRGGVITNPDRKRHVRELIPTGNLGPGSTYTFMRENGTGEGDPAMVSEGGIKPQFDFDLAEASVNIETLAGVVRFTRKAMLNIPGFISYLQAKMPQRLLKVEDAQILYGNGTTPNLKGLLTSGNFVASTSEETALIERILDDISLLEDTYEREANGIVMRPVTYNSFFKNKATGSGEYDLPANVVFVNGQLYISGIPVVKTTALNATDYVVGDFSGAQFLVQEGMRIEFFEQDRDNVIRNMVTARIEETVALPVYGSTYFIKGQTVLTP